MKLILKLCSHEKLKELIPSIQPVITKVKYYEDDIDCDDDIDYIKNNLQEIFDNY